MPRPIRLIILYSIIMTVCVSGIMLPHNLDEKPHVSDDLVDFSRSAVSLLSANDMFIKIHGNYICYIQVYSVTNIPGIMYFKLVVTRFLAIFLLHVHVLFISN